MRQILASIVLVVLLFPSLALGTTMDDLVETNGLHYKNIFKMFIGVPFTGKVTGKEQGSIKNGKRHGPWVSYHDYGQLWKKGTYRDGKEHGPWVSYHDTGQLLSKGTYKDGKLDGPWVGYHYNGQLSFKGTHKNGKRNGPWVEYRKNGQLYRKGTYKNGVKISD